MKVDFDELKIYIINLKAITKIIQKEHGQQANKRYHIKHSKVLYPKEGSEKVKE